MCVQHARSMRQQRHRLALSLEKMSAGLKASIWSIDATAILGLEPP